MQRNQLTRKNARTRTQRVGRGSTRGKTSGRGHKGQKARAGHCIRPAIRDIMKRIPKRRGHGKNRARTVNSARPDFVPVNISDLEKVFNTGDVVSPTTLFQKGLISRNGGQFPLVKILGAGTLTKKLSVEYCALSATAKAHIEKNGGTISD